MPAHFRLAAPTDRAILLELIREFYQLDQHPYDEARLRPALETLLATDQYGGAWLVTVEDALAGYFVLTYGFALESGGRDLLIDELYLRAVHRGQGLGRQIIAFIQAFGRDQGIRHLWLEVEAHNPQAREFYERVGFSVESSTYMSMNIL